MKKAVHREMAEVVDERLAFVVGLPPQGLVGDGDITEHARRIVVVTRAGRLQGGKRQYVGRLVDAAPIAVQRADTRIIGQHHREFGVADVGIGQFGRGRNGAQDHRFGVGFGLPAFGGDEDLGDGNGRIHLIK